MPSTAQPPAPSRPRHWLNRTVLGASLTSGLADMSYETANVLLPGFMAALGIPPTALGTIEGVADATASFMKMGAGFLSDRLGIRKSLVLVGYLLTVIGQAFMAVASGVGLLMFGRVVGWLGRGIRSPLRAAIMAEAVTPETRGRAFGFHRASDTVGAVLGPLLGVLMLGWLAPAVVDGVAPDLTAPYRTSLWLTLIPGVLAFLSFAILVRDDRRQPNKHMRFWASLSALPVPFRRYLVAVGAFGVGDFAHTLLILAATHLLTAAHGVLAASEMAGALYVLRNLVTTVAAFPIGVVADRIGHRRVLVVGYALGVATALAMALAFAFAVTSLAYLAGVFVLAGAYTAIQESLEDSLTAELVPAPSRGLAYGVLGSVNGVGDLVSSTGLGILWTAVSPALAFGVAAALMAVGTLAMARDPARRAA